MASTVLVGEVAAAAPAVSFLKALVTGPGGLPDEGAFVFLYVCQPLIIFGSIFNAFKTGHFAFADVVGCETGLIFLYNISIGARAKLGNQ